MNLTDRMNADLALVASSLREGKIDAATAMAHAAIHKATFRAMSVEIGIARTGNLIDVFKPIWRERLATQVAP